MDKSILLKPVGIPYEEVGPRLKELNEAIRKYDMALGVETDIHLTIGSVKDRVMSATITVYLLQKEETNKDNYCSTCRYGAECPDGPKTEHDKKNKLFHYNSNMTGD